MSGSLQHSQGEILQQLLIDNGAGGVVGSAWTVYHSFLPDDPAEAIAVFDTEGRIQGRTQVDGELQEFEGFQVRVRSDNKNNGYAKANAIKIILDAVRRQTVVVGTAEYLIHGITRSSGIIPLGIEVATKRRGWTINGVMSVRQMEVGTGS